MKRIWIYLVSSGIPPPLPVQSDMRGAKSGVEIEMPHAHTQFDGENVFQLLKAIR